MMSLHKKAYAEHCKKHKEPQLQKIVCYAKRHFISDLFFSLLVSLASLGIITLVYISAGIYIHFPNTATFFVFVLVSVMLVKYAHGVGKKQAFYSAFLASFGYFLFYRVYYYFIISDFWKMNSVVGDTLINAVINLAIIYYAYLLFIYCQNK